MGTYICIPNGDDIETFPTNTPAEIETAQAAMREAGITEAVIWIGEPDQTGDSYTDRKKLFA